MKPVPGVPGRPLGPGRPLSPSKPGDPLRPAKQQQMFWPFCGLVSPKDTDCVHCLTFSSRTSRTSRQTWSAISASSSWKTGLTLWPGKTYGACGEKSGNRLRSDPSISFSRPFSPVTPGSPPSPGPPFTPGKPGLPGKPLSPGAPSLPRPPEEGNESSYLK